uniref:Small ribosomal subunit protein bS6c n=2 Tax=Isochrysidaceae TaxID=418951 RepID=A0A3Q8CJI8_9EUKA|nr:ribosomal protein S6 [Tisochrysis lutea]YP_009873622.1 ribosomal protein S6 [Isochrysis galbana]AUM82531.1 ribosomal protein S6 [Tisochrysis lutea]QKW88505.1 ribosomal protein S6 [Isochrysis galbana]
MQKELELYEMLYLVDPSFTESELDSKTSFYRDFLISRGSQVMVQNRGKRSLSYKIRGCETANYIQMIYVGNQKLRENLNTTISRDSSVLRHLTTKIPKLPEVL